MQREAVVSAVRIIDGKELDTSALYLEYQYLHKGCVFSTRVSLEFDAFEDLTKYISITRCAVRSGGWLLQFIIGPYEMPGRGEELGWYVCEAFRRLGYAPPLAFVRLLKEEPPEFLRPVKTEILSAAQHSLNLAMKDVRESMKHLKVLKRIGSKAGEVI